MRCNKRCKELVHSAKMFYIYLSEHIICHTLHRCHVYIHKSPYLKNRGQPTLYLSLSFYMHLLNMYFSFYFIRMTLYLAFSFIALPTESIFIFPPSIIRLSLEKSRQSIPVCSKPYKLFSYIFSVIIYIVTVRSCCIVPHST